MTGGGGPGGNSGMMNAGGNAPYVKHEQGEVKVIISMKDHLKCVEKLQYSTACKLGSQNFG
jgi:hypothetical protein